MEEQDQHFGVLPLHPLKSLTPPQCSGGAFPAPSRIKNGWNYTTRPEDRKILGLWDWGFGLLLLHPTPPDPPGGFGGAGVGVGGPHLLPPPQALDPGGWEKLPVATLGSLGMTPKSHSGTMSLSPPGWCPQIRMLRGCSGTFY